MNDIHFVKCGEIGSDTNFSIVLKIHRKTLDKIGMIVYTRRVVRNWKHEGANKMTAQQTAKAIAQTLANEFPNQKFMVKADGETIPVAWTDGMSGTLVQRYTDDYTHVTFHRTYTKTYVAAFLKAYKAWRGNINGITIIGTEKAATIAGKNARQVKKINENMFASSEQTCGLSKTAF